jgi:four helix bundle protein
VTYDEWAETIPLEIKRDPVWHMAVYRQCLFLGEISWFDTCKLAQDRRTKAISDQLYRATGKLSSNITEGYSRASGKDQARFYEYALGSTRETRDWYYKGRHILGEKVAIHRIRLSTSISRQLLKMVPKYRGKQIKEEVASYEVYSLEDLLNDVPMSS